MTSTTDATQHPDVSEISDLTEGLLSTSRAADVRSHLDGCGPCADVHASLEEIRELLGAMPAPEPMPTDIADRLDAALADEALSQHTEAGITPDVSRETGSAVIAPDVADRPTGHARAATGPGRGPARRRRRTTALAALGAAAVVGVSVFLLQDVQLNNSDADASASDAGAKVSRVFSQSTLEDRVYGLLGSSEDSVSPQYSNGESSGAKEQAPSSGNKSSPNAQPENPLRAPAVSVPSCVEQGIGRNTAALAIDKGTYEGTDAFLVVLPHPTDASSVQAYVVDAACVGAEPPAKGKLLLTHTYARP